MSDEMSQRAKELFLQAVKLRPELLGGFLESSCGDDAGLRQEVDALLLQHQRTLEISTDSEESTKDSDLVGSTVIQRRNDPLIGQEIGGFRIKGILGSGGMGRVYLARQAKPRRIVALKILKPGISSPSALRRFEYESQILARLQHPGVAQVYEAGMYDDGMGGMPYFAMEYIPDAKPITEFAASRNLTVRERLELFANVCDAVYHGHQKGIIHRDLKPSNILVDSAGQPKIIDFGVARATDSDMAVTTLQTDVGQLIGTLQYMSPEQCNADPHSLTTASDVYCLGVILYELLCGRPPYDVASVAVFEAARMVRETQPPRPSANNRALRGDVETIVLKALEKESRRRYESASDFRRDIERYLHNEPIEARPPSVTYQIRLFGRRNRTVFASLCFAAVVLLCATIVSVVFALRATDHAEQRRRAELVALQEAAAARAATKQAENERDQTRAAQHRAELSAHAARMMWARSAIDSLDWEAANASLNRSPEEFRGWEWHHLRASLDRALQMPLPRIRKELLSNGPGRAWTEVVGGDGLAVNDMGDAAATYSSSHGKVFLLDLPSLTNVAILDLKAPEEGMGSIHSVHFLRQEHLLILTYEPDSKRGQVLTYNLSTRSSSRSWEFTSDFFSSAMVDPTGRFVAISDYEESHVMDLSTGKPLRSIAGRALAFTASCALITRNGNGKLEFHPLGTNTVASMMLAPGELDSNDNPSAVAVSLDGSLFAVGLYSSGDVLLYRTPQDDQLVPDGLRKVVPTRLRGHNSGIRSLLLDPAGQNLASTAENGLTEVWEVASGKKVASWLTSSAKWGLGQSDPAFLGNTGRMASVRDGQLQIWDPLVGESVQSYRNEIDIQLYHTWQFGGGTLSANHGSSMLAVRFPGGSPLIVWDLASMRQAYCLLPMPEKAHFLGWGCDAPEMDGSGGDLAVSTDGGVLALTAGTSVLTYDFTRGSMRKLDELGPARLDLSGDGRLLLVSNPEGHSAIDLKSGTIRWRRPVTEDPSHLPSDGSGFMSANCEIARFVLQDNCVAFARGRDGIFALADTEHGTNLALVRRDLGSTNSTSGISSWHPCPTSRDGDGRTLAVIGENPSPTGQLLSIWKLASDPSGQVYTAAEITRVPLERTDGQPVTGRGQSPQVALNTQGTRVAFIAGPHAIAILDAASGVELFRLAVPSHLVEDGGEFHSLAFADASRGLVAWCGAELIVWDTDSGQQRLERLGQQREAERLISEAWKIAMRERADPRDYAEALAQVQAAYKVSPWANRVLATRGILQFRLGEPAKAAETLRSSLDRQPADPFALGLRLPQNK